jgi:SAM-dependent methyltransferase
MTGIEIEPTHLETESPIDHVSTTGFDMYTCPTCKGALEIGVKLLTCPVCQVTYPIVNGIPDFIVEDLTQSTSQILRNVGIIDRLARIYETILWYPLVLNLYGGLGSTSLKELVLTISGIVGAVEGCILDVACGPGTYGRRIASATKSVYGIDISMGMLRQGASYVQRDNIPNTRFARATVEALPFRDEYFDASICCGSLHLFQDTMLALQEISRTMKRGAPLGVMTFCAGDRGILRFHQIREHVQEDHSALIFEIPVLEEYLSRAGFENFQPQTFGSVLVFSVRKKHE